MLDDSRKLPCSDASESFVSAYKAFLDGGLIRSRQWQPGLYIKQPDESGASHSCQVVLEGRDVYEGFVSRYFGVYQQRQEWDVKSS